MLTTEESHDVGSDEDEIVQESLLALLEYLLSRIADAAAAGGSYADWAAESGGVAQEVMDRLSELDGDLVGAVTRDVRETLARSQERDLSVIEAHLGELPPEIRGSLDDSSAATARGILDIVRRDNLAMASDAKELYLRLVARYVPLVNSGTMGFEDAVRRAAAELASSGIGFVDYRSGIRTHADVAMRRHVRTQIIQAGMARTLDLCLRTGVDYVEVSVCPDARPSHREWEGRIYSIRPDTATKYPDFWAGTGYGGERGPYTKLGDQLGGVNCHHSFGPYFDGMEPLYADMRENPRDDPDEVYRATQTQRRYERNVRAAKREADLLRSQGIDDAAARAKLGRWQRRLRELVGSHSYLVRDYDREHVWTPSGTQPRGRRS